MVFYKCSFHTYIQETAGVIFYFQGTSYRTDLEINPKISSGFRSYRHHLFGFSEPSVWRPSEIINLELNQNQYSKLTEVFPDKVLTKMDIQLQWRRLQCYWKHIKLNYILLTSSLWYSDIIYRKANFFNAFGEKHI